MTGKPNQKHPLNSAHDLMALFFLLTILGLERNGKKFPVSCFFLGGGGMVANYLPDKAEYGRRKVINMPQGTFYCFCRDHFTDFEFASVRSNPTKIQSVVMSFHGDHHTIYMPWNTKPIEIGNEKQPKSKPFNKICDFTRNLRFNPKIRLDISLHLNRHVCRYTRLQNMVHIRNNHQIRIRTSLLQ